MSDAIIGGNAIHELQTDWEKLRQLTPAEIHSALEADEDIQPTNEAFWQNAKVIMPQRKEVVTIRLDADLLAWLRREKGYQTRINAILRAYMVAQGSQPAQPTGQRS